MNFPRTSETRAGGAGAPLSDASPIYPLGRDLGQGETNRSFGIGGVSPEPIHNFSNELSDGGRLVLVGIGQGVSVPFIYIPSFFHEVQNDNLQQQCLAEKRTAHTKSYTATDS